LIKEGFGFHEEFKKKVTNNEIIYGKAKNELRKLTNEKSSFIIFSLEKSKNFIILASNNSELIENSKNTKFSNQITMIENEKKLNFFETKEDFLRKIEILERKIKNLRDSLQKLEKLEINRLVKEFDFHNYERKFNISPFYVFSSLLGTEQALVILLRHGMIKKEKRTV